MVVIVPEILPVPPVLGGAVELWVHELTVRLAAAGRSVAVISRPAGVAGVPGVEYRCVPWTPLERWCDTLKQRLGRRNPLRHAAKILSVWSYARRVARASRDFDIVYLHNEPNVLLLMPSRRGQRIVLHMHNDHLSIRALRLAYRRALRKAELVVFVSDFVRHQAAVIFPEHAQRFRTVLNATDLSVFRAGGTSAVAQEAFNIGVGAPRLLYVGRLARVKGVHVLIEAFEQLRDQFPQASLVIAGSSFFGEAVKTPYEGELARLAAKIGDAVVFTGYLPHAKLSALYRACDVVVVPSIWPEPFGLVVLEAMASGTCVVASAVGGLPEIIEDRRTGVLVRAGDPNALAAATREVLADPAFKRSLEQAATEVVARKFTWERLMGELEPLLLPSS
jgi:spore coat protein SA